jgi:hypothetical protein
VSFRADQTVVSGPLDRGAAAPPAGSSAKEPKEEAIGMEIGNVGDRILVESERVGERRREGFVQEVIGEGEHRHYRVRWEDGHESTFFPEAGSVTYVSPTAARKA